jgi:hypothetical protein
MAIRILFDILNLLIIAQSDCDETAMAQRSRQYVHCHLRGKFSVSIARKKAACWQPEKVSNLVGN